MKEERAVEALIGALGDERASVRIRAAAALAETTAEEFGEDAGAWERWWEGQRGRD